MSHIAFVSRGNESKCSILGPLPSFEKAFPAQPVFQFSLLRRLSRFDFTTKTFSCRLTCKSLQEACRLLTQNTHMHVVLLLRHCSCDQRRATCPNLGRVRNAWSQAAMRQQLCYSRYTARGCPNEPELLTILGHIPRLAFAFSIKPTTYSDIWNTARMFLSVSMKPSCSSCRAKKMSSRNSISSQNLTLARLAHRHLWCCWQQI